MRILVTGGAGFIGGELVDRLIRVPNNSIMVVDKLGYASNCVRLNRMSKKNNLSVECFDLRERSKTRSLLNLFAPDLVMHLAADSHVDQSIDEPSTVFINNVESTLVLMEEFRKYFMSNKLREQLPRFHYVSTDEVLGSGDEPNSSDLNPSSPYSASKASGELIVSGWRKTYDLPITISRSSNNYGSFQYPEKLIPITIIRALEGLPIEVFGDGSQSRNWLHVSDHARALEQIAKQGKAGELYQVGTNELVSNIELVKQICALLEVLKPSGISGGYNSLVTYVGDRPGHDQYYQLPNTQKIAELGWEPSIELQPGLKSVVSWYAKNSDWWQDLLRKNNYLKRKGLG